MAIWAPIQGLDALYLISDDGRVWSVRRNRELAPHIHSGYRRVSLPGRQALIHRLVAMAFIPTEDVSAPINHIDGNKANNRVANLEWTTPQGNAIHAFAAGLRRSQHGEKHGRAQLTEDQVREIRVGYAPRKHGYKAAMAEKHGVSVWAIKHVLAGTSWKHVN